MPKADFVYDVVNAASAAMRNSIQLGRGRDAFKV